MNHLLVNPYLLANIYGCNTYGSGSYNTNDCSEVQDGSAAGGLLSNTGSPMFIGIAAGVLLIVLAVVILFMGRRKKK